MYPEVRSDFLIRISSRCISCNDGRIPPSGMTTQGRDYPTRIPLTIQKKGQTVLDQIRTVDKTRLVKRMGKRDTSTAAKTLAVLQEMFAE